MFVTHYKRHCVDLSDVTLVDEDNNAINIDDANLVIPSKQCGNAFGATWWPTMEPTEISHSSDFTW